MRFLAYAGQRDAALDLVSRHRSGDIYAFPQPGRLNFFGSWPLLAATIETLAVLGHTDEAAELYPLFLEGAETSGAAIALWCTGSLTQTVAGIAAACGRQWEQAEEHYQVALRQAHELPHKTEQPEVRRWYARMLLDRDGPGDREKALELLTEAIAMYRQIGMPKHAEMAETMLGET